MTGEEMDSSCITVNPEVTLVINGGPSSAHLIGWAARSDYVRRAKLLTPLTAGSEMYLRDSVLLLIAHRRPRAPVRRKSHKPGHQAGKTINELARTKFT